MPASAASKVATLDNVKPGDVVYLDVDSPKNHWQIVELSKSPSGTTRVMIVKVGDKGIHRVGEKAHTHLSDNRWFFVKKINKIYVKERE